MDDPTASVVIAAKDPSFESLQLCIGSFAALKNAALLEMVIVSTAGLPPLADRITNRFSGFRIVIAPPEGVYAAYNLGIRNSKGRYVLFFGTDDIALPGMGSVLDQLSSPDADCHLLAAACFMQSIGIARPSRWRASLAIRNWCQQGIFYLRSYLAGHPFQTEYRVQADHKMNIDIVSNRALKFVVSEELIAYFSAGGLTSTVPDLRFRSDFPGIVGRAYGRPLGVLIKLKQWAVDLLLGDPERRFQARSGC